MAPSPLGKGGGSVSRAEQLRREVEGGKAVVANLRTDRELITWAKATGKLVRIDRKSRWGNPYKLADQGNDTERAEVCQRYEAEHLPAQPDLLDLIPTLRGKVLACWCSPAQCHGDTLARLANQGDPARDLRQWLWAIRGASPPGWFFEIRHTRAGRGMAQVFEPVTEIDNTVQLVTRLGQSQDTYVGVLPRVRRSGKAADVEVGHVAWVDLDDAEAVEAADTFPVPPSLKLSSGNGQHRYWVLDAPTPAAEIVEANRRLATHLKADLAATDRARIMRAPGTLNHKDPDDPRTCEVVSTVTETYALADLLAEVPPLPPKQAPRGKPLPTGTADDPLKRIPPPTYFAALAGVEVGRDGKVACPVHDDRTPSCHVWPDPEAGWHCFGCQAGGDVYELAARLWGMTTQGPGFVELRNRLLTELTGGHRA